jgi:hypothetical protein
MRNLPAEIVVSYVDPTIDDDEDLSNQPLNDEDGGNSND